MKNTIYLLLLGGFLCISNLIYAQSGCVAEAGTLAVELPTNGQLFCTSIPIQLTTTGNNNSANTIFALSDPATGNLIYLDQTGFFIAIPAGNYDAWVINTCGPLGDIPTNANSIMTIAATSTEYDIDGPIPIQIAPDLSIELTALCVETAGGYLIEVTIDGGAPAITGFGSYSLNFPYYSGTLTGTPPLTAVIADVTGVPFPGSVTIVVSVDSDGSLCEATETITIPQAPCEIDTYNNEIVSTITKENEWVSIYPNPNKGQFAINLNFESSQTTKLTVYNILGQQIKQVNLSGQVIHNMDMRAYSAGVYLLKFELGDRQEMVKMIVE